MQDQDKEKSDMAGKDRAGFQAQWLTFRQGLGGTGKGLGELAVGMGGARAWACGAARVTLRSKE